VRVIRRDRLERLLAETVDEPDAARALDRRVQLVVLALGVASVRDP